ncbi:unnamed protein product, partial [Tetraodon nigroviridis]
VAVALGFILVLGFLGNFLVLLVFSRFPRLLTPVNLLLVNISASDMLVSVFGTPLSLAASVRGRWLTGASGCRWYGFSNALFGVVSLVSYSLLSLERYAEVLWDPQTSASRYQRAKIAVAASWFYSLFWTLPPLFGWSSYGPEGLGTTCSVQWHQRTASSRSYIICLFIFCLLLPLLVMIFCYGRMLLALRAWSLRVSAAGTRSRPSAAGGGSDCCTVCVLQVGGAAGERREALVLQMVLCMVAGYLLCWMPYGAVAMLASFGPPGVVPPTASLIPSLLAKTSTVLNPVIYV